MPLARLYEPRDAEGVKALVEAVLPAYGLTVDFNGADADLADVPAHYEKKGGVFWVVEEDGRLLGMGGLTRPTPGVGEVRKMYFLPELRGKGFGRMLLEMMVAFARANGIHTLTLETASALKEAVRLYERFGFVRDDSLLHTNRCDLAYRYQVKAGP